MTALATPIEMLDGITDDTVCGDVIRTWMQWEDITDAGGRVAVSVVSWHTCLTGPATNVVAHLDLAIPGEPVIETCVEGRNNLWGLAGLLNADLHAAMIEAWDRALASYPHTPA
ncbi:hypothetical protein OG579_03800 [Williamsia herbipolensis]|uniref:Uncharacterized protein n=1 Tax=Williamsia herbipolensis TaxID=1603258 RepID=A0AAU4K4J6_9NOCA|nr:hypothetical protein [Williamsia herbipolensis]